MREVDRIIDLEEGACAMVAGVLYKDMPNKLSILDDYVDDND